MTINERPHQDAAVRHDTVVAQGKETRDRSPPSKLAITGQGVGGADPMHPHLFHLASAAASTYDGGQLQGAVADNWSVLAGQQGSVYLARLEPGGVHEPHWHPSAWELDFVISGRARWSLVGPHATSDSFEGGAGDLVFAPQGHYHYFETISDEDLVVLIVFNTDAAEPDDDIGIVAALSAIPPDALGAMFKTSPEAFGNIPKDKQRVVIARKPGVASAERSNDDD